MAARTPGLVRLEGHLGWDVQDDLTLIPGGWCWLWLDPLVFFHVAFHPPWGWTGFLMEWSQGGLQERANKNCKESSDLGLETVYCHPCPFHWSKQLRGRSVEGLFNGVNTKRYNPQNIL